MVRSWPPFHSSELRTMCIILKLDLRCCRGCRESMCRNLKRLHGVEQVEVREDEATLIVCGSGLDEAAILRLVKRRKGRSKVEVVSRIVHDAAALPGTEAGPAGFVHVVGDMPRVELGQTPKSEVEPERKPKQMPKAIPLPTAPTPSLPPLETCLEVCDESEQQKLQSRDSGKGETLVTERILPEFEGTKIRTRVTTSQDACTCIRVEETHFIIDRHGHTPRVHVINTQTM